MEDVAACAGGERVVVGAAEVKSPKSPKPALIWRWVAGLDGGVGFVLEIGAGLLSKKLPPEREEVGEAIEERGEARLAKGEGFAACCCCGGGEEKLRPPKASFRPASACELDCEGACWVGDARPPKAFDCCCCCCCGC